MKRTLVVVPNWVGDTVMALPVLEALEATGRHLAVLAKPGLHPLLEAWRPGLEAVARAGGDRRTVAAIRAAEVDEAVILPNSFRSAWLPFRAGVPRRWGYRSDLRDPILGPAVERPPGGRTPRRLRDTLAGRLALRLTGRRRVPFEERRPLGHQTLDHRELLAAMGVPAPTSWEPRLALGRELLEEGAAALRRAGVEPPEAPIVGLFPGAEFGPSKRWPAERFADLARALRRRRPELRIVLIAGPKEVWLAVRLHEQTGKIHPVIGPDLDLGRLAAALAHLDLLVTNDSGPMHLAAALEVPCVALFGPTDPRRTRPAGTGHRVLTTARWCAPCFRRRCPLGHHRCLRAIGVDEVVREALAELGESP